MKKSSGDDFAGSLVFDHGRDVGQPVTDFDDPAVDQYNGSYGDCCHIAAMQVG